VKKLFLSFSIIALFAIFSSSQRGSAFDMSMKGETNSKKLTLNTQDQNQTPVTQIPIQPTPATKSKTTTPTQTTTTKNPAPAPVPTPAPVPAKPVEQYRDGTYVGIVADAFYGNIQVQVVISRGKIADVVFLQYPNDRNTSIEINTQAMPMFKAEAIQAQSANVDGVSGATDSSIAFQESLSSTLSLAKN